MLRKVVITACAFAMTLGLAANASAQNDSPTKDIYFTFHQPVTVPTMTLQPGKYLFRHIAPNTGRTIVQIVNSNTGKLQATLMTVQAARSQAPDKPEIRLMETPADMPAAVSTWWYPGQRQGWEFIYPRDQATKLARTSKQSILTTAQNVAADDMKSADLVRMEPSGQEAHYSDGVGPTQTGLTGTAQRGEIVEDTLANRTAMNADVSASRTELPRTASATPLLALIGILAFAVAFAVRAWRQRLA